MRPTRSRRTTLTSIATAERTPAGVHEVVRRWTPDGDARAAVVMCHGLGEHSGRLEHAGDVLAAAGFAVTAYDQIGFGGSGGRRGALDDWSDVLDQIQRHVEDSKETGHPTVLFGISMGGLFALDYTLAERPRPDLLVLSSPALGGGAAWQKVLARALRPVLPNLMIPNQFKPEQLSRDPAVGAEYDADPLNVFKTTVSYGADFFDAMDRVRHAAVALEVPTLVLHGASDTIVPTESTAYLEEVPGVERRVYPALRHDLPHEPEKDEILGSIVEWIDGHLPAGSE